VTDTLPQLLLRNAERWGDGRVALREKELGIWRETTWAAYLENVRRFALGLIQLGFERGDKLAIVGDNRPEWVVAELAAQALGGASVGLYQDAVASELAFVIDHSDARIVVVEDQEQVDKLLEAGARIPRVKKIVFYDRTRDTRCCPSPRCSDSAMVSRPSASPKSSRAGRPANSRSSATRRGRPESRRARCSRTRT